MNCGWNLIYRDYLFKEKLPLYDKAMDAYALRQKTIAENIANATTPGYKPSEVKFEELFEGERASLAGARTDENHIPLGSQTSTGMESEVVAENVPAAEKYFSGESDVNIDNEMSALAQNQIRFRMASRVTKSYFDEMDRAIKGLT